MGTTGPYTELEYLVLAMVGEGINSGYTIRKTMNQMRGGRWSTESGSVYRVLKRLESDNLLRVARRSGSPNRERTEYEVTGQGSDLLHSWVTMPPERAEYAFLVDPLRTRSYFLNRLSQPERVRVVKMWLDESKMFCDGLNSEFEATEWPDPLRKMAYLNLLYLAEARHEWLKKLLAVVRKELTGQAVVDLSEAKAVPAVNA